jgi:pilus assembly protein Flp/PilA
MRARRGCIMARNSPQTGIKHGNSAALVIGVSPWKILPATMRVLSTWGLFMNFKHFWNDESGAAAIEYGLIAALIAVVIITGVTAVGTGLSSSFNTIQGNLK